jgi:hypothetical protein
MTEQGVKAFGCAVATKKDCEKWTSIVSGALSAHAALEHLFLKEGGVAVKRLEQILTSQHSKFRARDRAALSLEQVPAALVLLMHRLDGGLTIQKHIDKLVFHRSEGSSWSAAQQALVVDEREIRARLMRASHESLFPTILRH